MPEGGIGYGPQNQFKGSSKSLIEIADRCYAFSGEVAVPNSFRTLLEFTTGNTAYKVSAEFTVVSDSGTSTNDDYLFQLFLNEETIATWVTDKSATISLLMNPVTFIIPPFTKVKIRSYNNSTSTGNLVYAWMYGKKL